MIDEKMSWENQINYLNNKICRGVWAISQLKKYTDTKTLKMVYYSLIYPHLKYCITSWGKANSKTLQPLITTQKRVLRIMTNSTNRTRSDPLYMKLQLLKLNDIYKLQIAIAMYNISNKIWNIDSKTQPITSINTIHKHQTRLVKKIITIYCTFNKNKLR